MIVALGRYRDFIDDHYDPGLPNETIRFNSRTIIPFNEIARLCTSAMRELEACVGDYINGNDRDILRVHGRKLFKVLPNLDIFRID